MDLSQCLSFKLNLLSASAQTNQKHGWVKMINLPINVVLIPLTNTGNQGVVPVFVLDAYCVHMMGSIMNWI